MKLLSMMAVPIEQPLIPLTLKKQPRNYFFDRITRFSHYEFSEKNENFDILKDDFNQWYFIDTMPVQNLYQLKSFRQVHHKSTELYKRLPIVDLLAKFNLELAVHDYDKAFGHVFCVTDNLDSIPLHTQMQIANYIDESEPLLKSSVHYFTTIEENLRTRFIAGVESRSFATVTENKSYDNATWLKNDGINYLKLFLYFKQYKKTPSHQQIARLLCNLWASTEALNNDANPNLYEKVEL